MVDPKVSLISSVVATGHAYDKHVLGDDPNSPGINKFNDPNLGRDLGINSKADLQEYIEDMLSKEGTRAFRDPNTPGRYVFYNRADNTMLVLNGKDGDLGTIYRPERGPQAWQSLVNNARSGPSKVNIVGKPEDIEKLITGKKGFFKHVENDPRAKQNLQNRLDTITDHIDSPSGKFASKLADSLERLGKSGGPITGVVAGVAAALATVISGGSAAQASEVAFETAVPGGEVVTEVIEGDAHGAGRATATEVGGWAGAAGGAAAGAAIGSIVPGVGTVIGGVIGGFIGGIGGGFAGSAAGGAVYDAVAGKPDGNQVTTQAFSSQENLDAEGISTNPVGIAQNLTHDVVAQGAYGPKNQIENLFNAAVRRDSTGPSEEQELAVRGPSSDNSFTV